MPLPVHGGALAAFGIAEPMELGDNDAEGHGDPFQLPHNAQATLQVMNPTLDLEQYAGGFKGPLLQTSRGKRTPAKKAWSWIHGGLTWVHGGSMEIHREPT